MTPPRPAIDVPAAGGRQDGTAAGNQTANLRSVVRISRLIISGVLVAGLAACGTDNHATPADNLASTLEPIRSEAAIPGMAAAVWRDGRLIALGATGVRKFGDPTPVTVDDQWHLGSDTKAMTATLIGLYIDRGRLHFDDRLGTLFAGDPIDPVNANVTLEQLMQHRSGMADGPPDSDSDDYLHGTPSDIRTRAVRAVLAAPPARPVGTYAYSNMGYVTLGVVLERITGKTWEDLMRSELFGKLEMDSCGFGPPGTRDTVDQPWGHTVVDDKPVPMAPGDPASDNPPALGPAGTVHCSLTDWGKFLAVHLAGARGESTMLTKDTMTRLHQPPSGGDYAAGWMVADQPWAGGRVLAHDGSNTFWYASAWIAPEKNMVLTVVANRADERATTGIGKAVTALADTYAGH